MATASAPCFLAFPGGSHTSLWFHGRVWATSSASSPWSLVGAQQAEQHECLCPPDGGRVVWDVGVIDHAAGEEAVVSGMVATGGTLPMLVCEEDEGAAAEGGGAAAAGGGGGGSGGAPPQPTLRGALSFAPERAYTGASALALAARLFPEIHDAVVARADEVLVVEGRMRVARAALPWRPHWRGAAAGGLPTGATAKRRRGVPTVERFSDDEDDGGGGGGGGGGSGGASARSLAHAHAYDAEAGEAAAAAPLPAAPPPPGTVAALLARDFVGNRFLPVGHEHGHGGEDAGGEDDVMARGGSGQAPAHAHAHAHAHDGWGGIDAHAEDDGGWIDTRAGRRA
jgi:hypothetical protein